MAKYNVTLKDKDATVEEVTAVGFKEDEKMDLVFSDDKGKVVKKYGKGKWSTVERVREKVAKNEGNATRDS